MHINKKTHGSPLLLLLLLAGFRAALAVVIHVMKGLMGGATTHATVNISCKQTCSHTSLKMLFMIVTHCSFDLLLAADLVLEKDWTVPGGLLLVLHVVLNRVQ